MELEDRIIVTAPEGIELQLTLAGAGSRFIAGAIDLCLQLVLIVLAALVLFGLVGGGLARDLFAFAAFAAVFLYDILFETLASGRTPGKRLSHLRVVRTQGAPVDLPASAIRTLLRLIDALPTVYLVGLLSILVTARNQRLGDLAAGTLVIRDAAAPSTPSSATALPDAAGWDVSAVSAEQLTAVRRFLERREGLDRRARRELAHRLEQGLRPRVAGAPGALDPELFLEALARAKASR